jgi:hypothetical protein
VVTISWNISRLDAQFDKSRSDTFQQQFVLAPLDLEPEIVIRRKNYCTYVSTVEFSDETVAMHLGRLLTLKLVLYSIPVKLDLTKGIVLQPCSMLLDNG